MQLNGQDLAQPGLPGLSALPGRGDQQRAIDPSHAMISGLPQLQMLPKVPGVGSGLPIALVPNLATSRSLPNFTYSGVVPTGGLHNLAKVPDVSNLGSLAQAEGPIAPSLPAMGDDQRSLPAPTCWAPCPLAACWAACRSSVTCRVCPRCRRCRCWVARSGPCPRCRV